MWLVYWCTTFFTGVCALPACFKSPFTLNECVHVDITSHVFFLLSLLPANCFCSFRKTVLAVYEFPATLFFIPISHPTLSLPCCVLHTHTTHMYSQDEDEFNANKGQYEDMRSKIRARASEEGFEKSVATKKAIEEATQRAMAGQASATPDQMLDLSGFGEKFMDDSTDELTAEERAEIDKIASMPLLEQLQEELANTRFPTPMAIFQTACVMALIFAASATLILKGDSTIRDFYMDLNFIPRPDEVYDFSDLDLPDGFLEQQDLEGNIGSAFKAATETADSILDN